MPPNTVYVGRGTKFGNYFKVGETTIKGKLIKDRAMAVKLYRADIKKYAGKEFYEALEELRGKDLACWCPLDQPCHADVLLELLSKGA